MPTPLTNPEPPIPGFDAVAESRKWREATSRLLNSMSREERREYLAGAYARLVAALSENAAAPALQDAGESCIVREEPPKP